jgi:hypothetical protein
MTNIVHPLAWPVQRPRTPTFKTSAANFSKRRRPVSFEQGVQRVSLELSRFSATAVTVTSNRPPRGLADFFRRATGIDDPGVAVYFRLNGSSPHCLSCDRWDRTPDNLCAIAKHLEAIRGQLRWGAADVVQIFAGFKEIEPGPAGKPWWAVLGFDAWPASRAEIVVRYHELARQHHPDRGGNAAVMQEINVAYETGIEQTP